MMKSSFIPKAGDHFCVRLKSNDLSYSDRVYRCLGSDDYAVFFESQYRLMVVMPIDRANFYPVGPNVLRALGLVEDDAKG